MWSALTFPWKVYGNKSTPLLLVLERCYFNWRIVLLGWEVCCLSNGDSQTCGLLLFLNSLVLLTVWLSWTTEITFAGCSQSSVELPGHLSPSLNWNFLLLFNWFPMPFCFSFWEACKAFLIVSHNSCNFSLFFLLPFLLFLPFVLFLSSLLRSSFVYSLPPPDALFFKNLSSISENLFYAVELSYIFQLQI